MATIVIRGSTDNIMDDIERAVDDGVNTFKALTKVCSIEFQPRFKFSGNMVSSLIQIHWFT